MISSAILNVHLLVGIAADLRKRSKVSEISQIACNHVNEFRGKAIERILLRHCGVESGHPSPRHWIQRIGLAQKEVVGDGHYQGLRTIPNIGVYQEVKEGRD